MRRLDFIFFLCGFALIVTPGCSTVPGPSVSPVPTTNSPVATVAPSFSDSAGAVVGHFHMPASWTSAKAYLAPFYPDETGLNGFYVLEPSVHQNVDVVPGGYYQFPNVVPGQYVVVIGPSPEEAIAVAEGSEPRVVTVEAGKQLDMGEVQLITSP